MSEYIVKCKEFTSVTGKKLQLPEYIDQNQEIVRCRDCSHYAKGYCHKHAYEWNEYDMPDEGMFPMDENDFCSLGERLDE